MQTIKKISDLDPRDVSVLERILGQRLEGSAEVVLELRVSPPASTSSADEETGVPDWCNVLDGMSEEDLVDFEAALATPVRLARAPD